MKRWLVYCALLVSVASASAQEASLVPQILKDLRPRCIGPANMSGRLTDVAIYEKAPRIMYVASASGGLWKTVNNGTTWKPVFERETTVALGAVAVCPSIPDLVWVGTGEANARNSVSWGDGVYRSIDGGKTWQSRGLKETAHIGRIVFHPTDTDTVYVAALGKLWNSNKERGIFKTHDAGKTWQHVLALDEHTGCVDLAIDPVDPNILYAAAYQVRRDVFSGGNPVVQTGPQAGLYKTTDAGKTWRKLTAGLPGRPIGRCGLSISRKNPNVVFAVVQTDKTSVTVKGQAANQKLNLNAGGIFRSDDKGETWKHLNSLAPRPFYYGQVRVDPNDEQRLYVLGIEFHVSNNGGKTFLAGTGAKGTHGDYHALWIDPRDPYHMVLGGDGGLYYSYDKGKTWEHLKNLPVSQFYALAVDSRKPYRVYGGLQDNGTWGGISNVPDGLGINLAQWSNVLGYDGYYCSVHPTDNDIVYMEGQYGILYRKNVRTGAGAYIRPRLTAMEVMTNIEPPLPQGTADFRFNWSSPLLQSPYSPNEIFYGGNFLFASDNRGDTWQVVSPDLTLGKPGPNDFRGHTLTTIAASPLEDHVIYTGADDGAICVCKSWKTREWTDLSGSIPGLPAERCITRLECSHFAKGLVYLALDRHRNDDQKPYLYKSVDYGLSWTSIVANLPQSGPVLVIREDPVNKDVLYVGTEFGLYITLDAGKTWNKQTHLPTVPVHDLVVHPRDQELVIGTHGRAIWIQNVLPLQELTTQVLQKDAHLCAVRSATALRQRSASGLGIKGFVGENAPYGVTISYYLGTAHPQDGTLTILADNGQKVGEFAASKQPGLHHVVWKMNQPGTKQGEFNPVPAGTYTAIFKISDRTMRQTFQVAVDD